MSLDSHQSSNHEISRQEFLRRAGITAASVAAVAGTYGCGSSGTSATAGQGGEPRRGGTLHAALTGGTSSDTLDGQNGLNTVDAARTIALYDFLVSLDLNAQPQLGLAQEISPNHDATQWTIRLRPDIAFHNGKPLTAEDVIYSLRRIIKNHYPAASTLAAVDAQNLKPLDKLTVRVPMRQPFSIFVEALAGYFYSLAIVPVGYDPKQPVGTGPFSYVSFTPGQQSVFRRNDNYWQTGKPYADKLVISNFPDETSQVNALIGGQADLANNLSASSIGQVNSSASALIANGGGMTPFTMRVDASPFTDVRVRQAMRLLCDRQQMLDSVFEGHGTIANDIFSPYDPAYDRSIPQRAHDPEQARSLLKTAGYDGHTFELVTSDVAAGTLNVAQVFAQQAQAAGITVTLRQLTPTDFYGSQYLKWVFAQDYWLYSNYLPQVAQAMLPDSPFNETHWNDKRYNALYTEAVGTLDRTRQRNIVHEMQRVDYTQGGYIIPYFPPVIDGVGKRVQGAHPSKAGFSLGNYGFKDMWMQ
jgi:peptide/nickel transport system substrate-binding protein